MANSEIGTSSSNTVGCEYQVFLSFRGPDTRHTFTNVLHQALVDARISVFIDDEGLQPGERISGNFLQAIDNSKLYIPIFSKKYATSHRCLEELTRMVENTAKYKEDGKEKVILPIFYYVKPNDVKLETTLYKDALSTLEKKTEDQKSNFSFEDVKKWRQALEEVGGIKGWELEKYPGHVELIQAVVDEVVVRLETRQRDVTGDLVGTEDQIAAIKKLLDIDSGGVRLIGICGMCGIGKTTLAKIIFNQLCPHFGRNCSFVDDVRETEKNNGLVKLQKKLLLDISCPRVAAKIVNIDGGTNKIEETICNRKMLIVLDDVDEAKQIRKLIGEGFLYPGTRILVTTRDKSVLNIRDFKYEFKDYELEKLSDKDALKLFSRHAFNDSSPPADYYNLSKDIVSTVGGLPLALEKIGSSLFGQRNKRIWEERLEKLRKTPHKGVLGKLKISYDALESAHQQSMGKMKDEARQQVSDMETSDRNYAIAAVQNVVGIDDRVKQITDLLEMEVNDEVSIIGIYGTDGIGKTTLAKAVYDRIPSCFDSCSFLAEFEETTRNPNGIQFLQTKLMRDLLKRDHEEPSFDERIEDFKDIVREMKVLIVIDDVEKQSHLHAIVGDQYWFGLGSRIIVTSQNEEILKGYDPEKVRTYMVGKLDDDQAFELFCQHAFGKKSPTPGYHGHASCVVKATEKLPLAIEVIGSFLRGKSVGEWEKMEESIKKFISGSEKTTVCFAEILDICYEALHPTQKQIFLDIACFITGVDARIASYMWRSPYLPSPDCILMPLAKVGENNELQMHRLLRYVGRRILNQKGSGDPTRRKFYIPDMVPKSISKEKGMENVEALCIDLDDHDSCEFTAGDFGRLPDKTFLKLDNAKVFGDFIGAFPSVKWLSWQRCPPDFNAENIVLRELVILDLSWSKVTEDWRGWSEIKMEKLKVLNLTGCSDLLFTPDFSGYKDLEILILERCSRLVKLDPSISHLKCLVSLNLKFCSHLNGLPVEIGYMTALKELSIDGTSVRQIPISIGNLKHLEILSGFKCFSLTHLPSSISYLTALSKLSLDGTKIDDLPSSLGELHNLRHLSLRDCRYMEELPDSIGKMELLEELDISATSISNFPDSIRNLQSLRVLRMDSTFIRAFPGEIGNLTKLEELHASWCRSLKGAIPSDIGGLRHLRSLTLGHSSISSLPLEISTIPGLHTLDLLHCDEIEELLKLPPSLICLHVSSKRMKAIPLLEDLKELEELCLSDGDPKAHQPPSKQPMPESNVNPMIDKQSFSISFPKLRKLELSLSQVIKLKFEPTDMTSLKRLKRLKMLTLPGLSRKEVSELAKTLSVFKLYHSAIEEIEGLEGLEALKRLDISNCKLQNLNGLDQLTSLRSLILSDCDYLSLPDLSNLKSLKVLEIRRCKMIRQIKGLEKLTSLEKLNISECPAENSVQVQKALKHEFESTNSGTETGDPPQKTKRKRETESAKQEGKRQRHVTGDLVGMEDQIEAIKKLLDIDSSDVRLIGIYGMGGIGKTILAKTIFDQLCPRFGRNCSFLDDVSERAKTKNLVELQKSLLSDISYFRVAHTIDNIEHGIKMIEDTICNKKALIVLDDVDKANQIQLLIGEKSLCPGTRIVITTRDRSILNIRRYKDIVKYEMMRLNEKDALKLFSRHAFNDDSPPDNYYTLSRRIVSIVDGLPLALEAIGSMLFVVEEREKWEELLKELKETPHQNVLAKLRISYDALEPTEQQIFLDIACFFIGENKTNPIYVWKDCEFFPEHAIEALIDKCMIKELDDNSLWMHNQFRNLGRTIAKKEGIRLWDEDDIICKLRSIEMKGNVQALCFRGEFGNPITVTSEQIKRFPHIRFLSLYEVICQGDFTGCLSELKWINLHCPYSIHHGSAIHRQSFEAIDSLHLENVVVVNLSGVDITQDLFMSLTKGARKLKVLSLHYNTLIRETSIFSRYSVIEKLTISNFFSLVKIDYSIGKLKKLTDLSFESCVKLEKLPKQIGELKQLQHLSLRCCNSLRELPNSVLKLESLTKLDVLGTRITRLPDSIGRLSSLSSINVSFTLIEKLPSTMSKLLRLQTLHLNHCDQIQELPELPRNLTTLQLTSTSLVTVPNLSYLVNLVELALSNGSESMAKSDIIQTCDLQWMGSLSKLSKLQFCFSNVCVSTIELASLPLLEELTLHGVDVPAFKQLPPKLIVLELYDTRGKQVRPPPLEKETAIVSSGSTKSGESEVLRQIEVEFMEEHKSSEGSVRLREEPGCNELQAPELIDHWRGDFHFPSSLNMLRKFFLWGCPGVQDIQFVSTLESLLVFSVGGCTSLKRLGGLSNLKNLMELTLNRCWSLQVVEGINELEFLHQLKIDRCRSMERILDPSNSKIPGRCSILITGSGELPDCGQTSDTWESYRVRFFREEKSSFDFFS